MDGLIMLKVCFYFLLLRPRCYHTNLEIIFFLVGIWLTPSTSSPTRIPLLAESPSHLSDSDTSTSSSSTRSAYTTSSPITSTPFLTLIGSSNYGQRSATRDLEANLLVVTTSSELRNDLKEEVLGLRHFAAGGKGGNEGLVNSALFARKERKVKWGVKVASRLISDML